MGLNVRVKLELNFCKWSWFTMRIYKDKDSPECFDTPSDGDVLCTSFRWLHRDF